MTNTSEPELWAILNLKGEVMWSRGGSSSAKHLMVYATKEKAEKALNNCWTRQIIIPKDVKIKMIYKPTVGMECE
tara:strand:- start:20298 stop:20522 length:225 start_codon:yes stop_codon:yes gene_type:complete